MEIPNQEEHNVTSGQRQSGNIHDPDDQTNKNIQKGRIIIFFFDLRITNMRVMSTEKLTVTMLLD